MYKYVIVIVKKINIFKHKFVILTQVIVFKYINLHIFLTIIIIFSFSTIYELHIFQYIVDNTLKKLTMMNETFVE